MLYVYTDTGLDLSGKTKVCVMWVTLYVNLDRGWLIVFFKNGIVVWFQGIALLLYSSFKQSHSLADYLCIIKKGFLRRNSIRFRLRVSPLKTHRLRYTDRSQGNYTWPFCKDSDETEINFLFVCPNYKTLKETYLLEKFYLRPSAFKMAILLADTRQTLPLAVFIPKAFE